MKPSPCLNPVRVYSESLGEYLHVPCGHCDACVASKGFNRSNRLTDHISQFRFKYFVTLTYADDFLPFADVIGDKLVHSKDKDYKGKLHEADGVSWYLDNDPATVELFNYAREHYNGRVPVLSHLDLRRFKNRLRYYVKKECNLNNIEYESLYIYCCGEYGPQHCRPHYHLLLCTQSRHIGCLLEGCVREAWTTRFKTSERTVSKSELGFINFQRDVSGNCSKYVAQYLNCATHLPLILSRTVFRPFSTTASFCDCEFNRLEGFSAHSFIFNPVAQLNYKSPVNGEVTIIPVPQFVENRFFPRFAGYGRISPCCRLSLYGVAALWPSPSEFINYWSAVFADGFDLCLSDLSKALFWLYYRESTPDSFSCALTKLWYVSRRVLINCEYFGFSLSAYVGRIDVYYSKRSLLRLRNFYELQCSLLDDGIPLSNLISLYYDTPDSLSNVEIYKSQFGVGVSPSVNEIPLQYRYAHIMHKIINDTIKTKKRNDYFLAHGKRRSPYKPLLKSKISKFLNI